MKALRAVSAHAQASFAEMDLGFSDFLILECLLHRGPQLVNDIGRSIQLTSGSITTAIDRLESRDLVARTVAPDDKRARIVSLTKAGRAWIEESFAAHKKRLDKTSGTLSDREIATLQRLLKKLGKGAAEMLPKKE